MMTELSSEALAEMLDNSQVIITVTQTSTQETFQECVYGTDKKTSSRLEQIAYVLKDIGLGFVGWDTQTKYGFVASLVGGFFAISDVGTNVKNFYYLCDSSDETEFSLLETTLSIVGLVPVVGDAALIGKVFRYANNAEGYGNTALNLASDAAKGGDKLEDIKPLVTELSESPEFLTDTLKIEGSAQNLGEEAMALAKVGSNGKTAYKKVFNELVEELGPEIGEKFNKVLSKIDDSVLTVIKDEDSLRNLGKIMKRGEVDPERMTRILNKVSDFWPSNYSQANLLQDLGKLADHLPDQKGFGALISHLSARVPNEPMFRNFFLGRLAEVRAGSVLLDRGVVLDKSLVWTKELYDDLGNYLGKTDIDLQDITGIRYQIMRDVGTKYANELKRWLTKMKTDLGPGIDLKSKVRIVTNGGADDLDAGVVKMLKEELGVRDLKDYVINVGAMPGN